MKKQKLKKNVVIATISGLLVSSCDNHNLDDNIYGNFAENKSENVAFYSIEDSNLSESFFYHVNIFNSIIKDMMTNKEMADLFCTNPDEYLKIKKIPATFQITEEQKILIKAFCDEDVIEVVKENNLQKFITICKEKGYLNFRTRKLDNEINDYSIYFKDNEDFEKFKQYILDSGGEEIAPMAAIPAVTVGIGSVAAALYAVAGVSAAVGENVVYYLDFWWDSGEAQNAQMLTRLSSREPVIKLWLNSSNSKVDYDMVYSEIIEKRVNEIMDIFYENCDSVEIDSHKLKELIRINLEGAYGLRK